MQHDCDSDSNGIWYAQNNTLKGLETMQHEGDSESNYNWYAQNNTLRGSGNYATWMW